ncbi:MAG TPA: Hpt domain-containing protein [Bryobacteraceae bacterium]|nr:Hpt domain-containing protein [Bryobacteraceae bacterium]
MAHNPELSVLDREQLRNVTLDDEALMREVLSALIDDTLRQIQLLDHAIRTRDAGETIRLAHYSKGACANIGAQTTTELLRQIERTAAKGDFDGCGTSLHFLAGELEKLRAEAQQV